MKKTMKDLGITRTDVIKSIVARIQEDYGITKALANELFNESLVYSDVTAEIYDKVEWMLENPDNRFNWSS